MRKLGLECVEEKKEKLPKETPQQEKPSPIKFPVPKGKSLRSYQLNALRYFQRFLRERRGFYNGSEQGCGKTPETIVLLNYLECYRTLIICPSSMTLKWAEELRAWTTLPDLKILPVLSGKDIEKIGSADTVITSYDLATQHVIRFGINEWDALVMDEIHKLKNKDAKRTKVILGYYYRVNPKDKRSNKLYVPGLWDRSNYHMCLSGTPFTQGIKDGFTLFNKLAPDEFPDYHKFMGRYAYAVSNGFGVDYYGLKNEEELRSIIRTSFYYRDNKADVLKELPDKCYSRITLPKTFRAEATLDAEAAAKRIKEFLDKDLPPPVIPSSLAGERKLQGVKKLPPIFEFIEDLLEENTPTVVFAYHTDVINELTARFADYSPSVIDGSVTGALRKFQVDRFQEGETLLFIGQISAAGEGITLTRSSTCVFAEIDWSPSVIDQAVSRLHRFGQKDTVIAYYFIVEGSIETQIVETVVAKARIFGKVV